MTNREWPTRSLIQKIFKYFKYQIRSFKWSIKSTKELSLVKITCSSSVNNPSKNPQASLGKKVPNAFLFLQAKVIADKSQYILYLIHTPILRIHYDKDLYRKSWKISWYDKSPLIGFPIGCHDNVQNWDLDKDPIRNITGTMVSYLLLSVSTRNELSNLWFLTVEEYVSKHERQQIKWKKVVLFKASNSLLNHTLEVSIKAGLHSHFQTGKKI